MPDKISFLILEKSYVIRSGLMKIIDSFPETGEIYELENPDLLLKTVNKKQPKAVIINRKLTENNKNLILKTKKENPGLKMIILVGTKRSAENFPDFDLKISVDEAKTDITDKLQRLIKELKPDTKEDNSDELSDREKEVLRQVALGKTNKEIGETLFISMHTVITHRKNITGKLGIKTVSGLTVYAILNNLIKIDEAV